MWWPVYGLDIDILDWNSSRCRLPNMVAFYCVLLLSSLILSLTTACIPTESPEDDDMYDELVTTSLATMVSEVTTTTTTSYMCLIDWEYNPANNFCYFVNTDLLTSAAAEAHCASLTTNGHLTSILNAAENTYVYNLLFNAIPTPAPVWIGLKGDPGVPFMWTDGNTFAYSNWNTVVVPPQPDVLMSVARWTFMPVHAVNYMNMDWGDVQDVNMLYRSICKAPPILVTGL